MFNKINMSYNLCPMHEFEPKIKRTIFTAFFYRAPQLWANLPNKTREKNSINYFKSGARKEPCNYCVCRW